MDRHRAAAQTARTAPAAPAATGEAPSLRARLAPQWRKWKRPLGVTVVTATILAALYSLFLENTFPDLLVTTQVVGLTLLLLLYPALTMQLSPLWHALTVGAALAVGAVSGTVLVVLVKGRDLGAVFTDSEYLGRFLTTVSMGLSAGLIAVFVFAVRARIARAEAEVMRIEAERQSLARKSAEAELKVIRAQIEPHFLINTLANLSFLIKDNPAQAQAMLENLIDYLQVALPRIRGETGTLRNELTMASAYVAILQIRMGARLQSNFEIPAALRDAPFPPMMLITLIENAIQHGLNPLPEGGTVGVRAECHNGRLTVSVSDDGMGISPPLLRTREGIGLANIRERLQAMYGDAARLVLAPRSPRGTMARIELPLEGCLE